MVVAVCHQRFLFAPPYVIVSSFLEDIYIIT